MSDQNECRQTDACLCPECSARKSAGLPQSELGGLHPELRARITAARAVLGDFDREVAEYVESSGLYQPDNATWASRLAAELRGLLDTIGRLS